MYRNYPGLNKFPKLDVTMGFIISWAVAFVICWLPGIGPSFRNLFGLSPSHPWSFITYMWTFGGPGDFFNLFFSCFFLLGFAKTIQAMTSPIGTAFIYLGSAASFGLLALLMTVLLKPPVILLGPYLTVSFILILWCSLNRSQVMNLYGILPIPAPWIAALIAGGVLFVYGAANPLVGVVMIAPLAVAWIFPSAIVYGSRSIPVGLGQRKQKKAKDEQFDEYMTKVKAKESARDEREKLRRLFENSFKDDEPKL